MKLHIAIEISDDQARKMIEACGFEIKQVQYIDWVKVYHNRLESKEVKSEMVEIGGRHCTI